MKTLNFILGVMMLLSLPSVTAQTKVDIDMSTERYLGTVSDLDRTKYFTIHSNSNDADHQKLYKDFNVTRGRGFWGAFSYAKNKTGVVGEYPEYITSDNTSERNVSRFVATEHPRNVVRYDLDKEKGAAWAAEYYKNHVNDSGRPEFFEPMNEPFVHSGDAVFSEQQPDAQKMRIRMAEWFGAIGKKFDETPELSKMKVIGYSSAWPSMELWDFGHWDSRMKMFMDVAGDHIDAFATHLYDGVNVTGQDNKRSGSNSEAILDLIETYSYAKWGVIKPHAITEYGGIERGYPAGYSDIKSAISLKSINALLFNLLERENRMAISIPFITGKATWYINASNNYQTYIPALWRPLSITPTDNPNRPILEDWSYTAKIDFYKLWSDVKGKRILVNSSNPDVQIQGFATDKKVYVALNNLDDKEQVVELNMVSGLSGLQKIRSKSLRIYENSNPEYTDSEIEKAPNTITLIPNETVVLEYTFNTDLAFANTIRSKNYYTTKHLQKIEANTDIVFNFNNVQVGSGFAKLKMAIGRKHNVSKSPKLKINGVEVHVPTNWKGYDQRNRGDFFGTIDIPFPIELLKVDNTITVNFPDSGGRVSSMILEVEKYDKAVIGKKDTILFPEVITSLPIADSYSINVNYEATTNREIIAEFWLAKSKLASSKRLVVPAGSGTRSISLKLPAMAEPGDQYSFKTYIRPIGENEGKYLDTAQIDNIVISEIIEYDDLVSFKDAPTTIPSTTSYSFNLDYEASTDREIVVEFWSATNWMGQQKEIVPTGRGVKSITVNLSSAPSPGEGYVYKTHIRPLGTNWQQAIDTDQVNNVTIIDGGEKENMLFNINNLRISSNPVKEKFTIHNLTNPVLIQVSNLKGQKVLSKVIGKYNSIDVSSYKRGIYFISINNSPFTKFLKQ
ncbi:T9SS type A sorting domain-containing protein [Aquimarina aggregata]|uniref:T9SS type A sorting domain-containing protein n=1 Tax=Aquimarina aggregata TaxID=1642818 RepID=UPI002492B52A|nr:T9SS type A sorting domain-containing protein [Aquimarina aggregata]